MVADTLLTDGKHVSKVSTDLVVIVAANLSKGHVQYLDFMEIICAAAIRWAQSVAVHTADHVGRLSMF